MRCTRCSGRVVSLHDTRQVLYAECLVVHHSLHEGYPQREQGCKFARADLSVGSNEGLALNWCPQAWLSEDCWCVLVCSSSPPWAHQVLPRLQWWSRWVSSTEGLLLECILYPRSWECSAHAQLIEELTCLGKVEGRWFHWNQAGYLRHDSREQLVQ